MRAKRLAEFSLFRTRVFSRDHVDKNPITIACWYYQAFAHGIEWVPVDFLRCAYISTQPECCATHNRLENVWTVYAITKHVVERTRATERRKSFIQDTRRTNRMAWTFGRLHGNDSVRCPRVRFGMAFLERGRCSAAITATRNLRSGRIVNNRTSDLNTITNPTCRADRYVRHLIEILYRP